jgi:DNA-binding NtrC family response regulator
VNAPSSSGFPFSLNAQEGEWMPKRKILVVEDEPTVQKVCSMVLRNHGFEPIIAENGLDGLNTYRERHAEICLTLADVSMPVLGGIEMVRCLFEMHSHVNVILMTGYSAAELIPDEVRRLCSVLQKPFTPQYLIEAVNKCLQYDKDHQSSASA